SEWAAITEGEWHDSRVDDEIPVGESIWLGLDLGWKYDTTAAVPLWIKSPTYRLLGPATVLEPPLDGKQLSAHTVKDAIRAIHKRNPIACVVMDPSNGAELSEWMHEELGSVVFSSSQKSALKSECYNSFMEALREGWLKHTGDDQLKRHALNAVAV